MWILKEGPLPAPALPPIWAFQQLSHLFQGRRAGGGEALGHILTHPT